MNPESPVQPEFLPLGSEDIQHLERQREWVRGHFVESAQAKYGNLPDKLRLLQTILDQGWISPTETWKLQSLGVALGDAFVQKLGLDWMILIDEYGRAPTLKDPAFELNINPLTMISRRIEAGETVDVQELFLLGCSRVEELRSASAALRKTR